VIAPCGITFFGMATLKSPVFAAQKATRNSKNYFAEYDFRIESKYLRFLL